MSLLNRILKLLNRKGPEQSQEELDKEKQLKDFIFDWFNEKGASISTFEEEVFFPVLEAYKLNENLAEYIEAHPEKAYGKYFDHFGILYLAAQEPSNEELSRLFHFIQSNNYYFTALKEHLRVFNPDHLEKQSYEAWKTLKRGKDRLKTYEAIYGGGYKFAEYASIASNLGNLVYLDDSSPFQSEFQYIKRQKVDSTLFVFLGASVSRTYVRDKQANPQAVASLKNGIQELIQLYQPLYNFNFDFELAWDFCTEILNQTPEKVHPRMDHRARKKLGLQEFPAALAFLEKYKDKAIAVLQLYTYYFSYEYERENKFIRDFLKQLVAKAKVDKEKLAHLLRPAFYNQKLFFLNHIYTPLFKRIVKAILPHEEVLQLYEAAALRQVTGYKGLEKSQKHLDLIRKKYLELTDPLERSIYGSKYNGIYVSFNDKHQKIYPYHTSKKMIEKGLMTLCTQLNCLFPTSLKSNKINPNYYYGNQDAIILNIDGADQTFSLDYINELNALITEKALGYRLITIPLCQFTQNKNTLILGSLALLNFEQFRYLMQEYLPKHFPDYANAKVFTSHKYHKTDAPILNLEDNKTKTAATSSGNLFLTDSSWLWFKTDYIDQLQSKAQWYEIMNVLIQCKGSTKANKKWLEDLQKVIDKMGEERYFKELAVLMNGSLKEEFWLLEAYRKTLKGIIWSCTAYSNDTGLSIVKNIVERAYRKIPGIGPTSSAVGNLGLNALALSGEEKAFGILNIIRNKTKYARFIKVLDKYLEKFQESSDIEPEALADRAIPKFDFIDGEKIVPLNDQISVLYRFKKQSLSKKWLVDGKEQYKAPEILKTTLKKEAKEIAEEFKQINSVFKPLKERVKTFWLYDRKWAFTDWEAYIFKQPLLYPWINQMIWRNESEKTNFILSEGQFLGLDGKIHQPKAAAILSLWHPIDAEIKEIQNWQNYLLEHKIQQPLRQVYREHYPFSERELAMEQSPRFSHHFLKVNKAMAVANAAGWRFTYSHEGNSWPRKHIKHFDSTVHLRCDYSRSDIAVPTKAFFFTKGDTSQIEYINPDKAFEHLKFEDVPAKTRSELCRDVDLIIATSSIANDPELSIQSENFKHYREDFNHGKFSANASAKIRRTILEQVAPALKIKNPIFEGNYMIVKGSLNSYRINLGSGFAQIEGSQRHINLLPDIKPMKQSKKIHIPIQDDETLYIILAKALFLQQDAQVQDESLRKLLST